MRSYFSDKIPITVITGFLGSGKTTLLNRLLESRKMANTLVMINEYGDVAIDHLITQQLTDNVVLLESGCVCCTLRGEFQVTLLDLFAQHDAEMIPPFDHLILETTGLADPAPVLQILMTDKLVMECFSFNGLICLVDTVLGEKTLSQNDISVKQVSMADLLILTKGDLATKGQSTAVKGMLAHLNPEVKMIPVGQVNGPDDMFINIAAEASPEQRFLSFLSFGEYDATKQCTHEGVDDCHHDDEHSHSHISGISTFTLYPETISGRGQLLERLEDIVLNSNDQILRIKGIVKTDNCDRPVIVHGVQNLFHPLVELEDWPDADHRSRIVFIGHDLDKKMIEKTLYR